MLAAQVLSFGFTEDSITFGSSGTTTYSTGVLLDNPQYYGLAAHVTIVGAVSGFVGSIVVQTRAEPNSPAITPGNSDWVDTGVAITVTQSSTTTRFQIPIPAAVLDAARLKFVRLSGSADLTWTVVWLADQSVTAL